MVNMCMLIETNDKGVGRLKKGSMQPLDLGVERFELNEQYVAAQLQDAIQKSLQKDSLYFVAVNLTIEEYYTVDGTDYDDFFDIVSIALVVDNYSEFTRKKITKEIAHIMKVEEYKGTASINAGTPYKNFVLGLVVDWEDFFEKEFTPITPPAGLALSFGGILKQELGDDRGGM